MKPLAPAVLPALLRREIDALGPARTLIDDGDRVVVQFRAWEAPSVMHELGRLRELCFRLCGEGTGESLDVDNFDDVYTQVVAFDWPSESIIGGYRVARTDDRLALDGIDGLYSSTLFDYQTAIAPLLIPALELGRSFVAPEWQRSMHGLPLLWRGLGAFWQKQNGCHRMLGPVSIDREYSDATIELILGHLWARHGVEGAERMVVPRNPFVPQGEHFVRGAQVDSVVLLDRLVKEREGRGMPVLLRHYLKLGAKVLAFNVDPDFQDCVDALLLLDLRSMDPRRRARYAPPDLRAPDAA